MRELNDGFPAVETMTADEARAVLVSRRLPVENLDDVAVAVLVFATGFDALTGAMTRIDPKGPDGQRLSDIWADGPLTFLGVMVPRLPNLFSFSGPGSPSVLANMVLHAEVQVDWAVGLMVDAQVRGITEVEPRRDAARRGPTVWRRRLSGRCSRGRSRRGT
jgi:cation diffusion facilitator CzcD-associated flavoprotein CzcO